MIVKNPKREPPSEWSDGAIEELIEHTSDLAANGNPAGFFVGQGLRQAMSANPTEDYAAYRAWIEANADLVRTAWQLRTTIRCRASPLPFEPFTLR